MKKVIAMENLDCANCAAKMERSINKLDGVKNCTINFMLQRMTVELEDNAEDVLKNIQLAVKKVEPDCRLKI